VLGIYICEQSEQFYLNAGDGVEGWNLRKKDKLLRALLGCFYGKRMLSKTFIFGFIELVGR
jgi:hypothetical protein